MFAMALLLLITGWIIHCFGAESQLPSPQDFTRKLINEAEREAWTKIGEAEVELFLAPYTTPDNDKVIAFLPQTLSVSHDCPMRPEKRCNDSNPCIVLTKLKEEALERGSGCRESMQSLISQEVWAKQQRHNAQIKYEQRRTRLNSQHFGWNHTELEAIRLFANEKTYTSDSSHHDVLHALNPSTICLPTSWSGQARIKANQIRSLVHADRNCAVFDCQQAHLDD